MFGARFSGYEGRVKVGGGGLGGEMGGEERRTIFSETLFNIHESNRGGKNLIMGGVGGGGGVENREEGMLWQKG